MDTKADAVTFNPTGTALAFGDYLVFLKELLCYLGKAPFCLQQARPILPTQREIPVFGDVPGQFQTRFPSTSAWLLATNRS